MREHNCPTPQKADSSLLADTGIQRAAPIRAHLAVRLFAGRFDRMLTDGKSAPGRSTFNLHAQRLITVQERESIARTFRRCVHDAHHGTPLLSSRVSLDRDNIVAAEDLIDTVTPWMHSPRPVDPRGMARLRLLLADGAGPLYRYGRGDLEARLRALRWLEATRKSPTASRSITHWA